jgi:hypothetical protein
MQPIKTFEVPGARLEAFEDRIRITPTGFLGFFSKGFSGPKEIYCSSIAAIQFREGGVIQGYIQFTIAGQGNRVWDLT